MTGNEALKLLMEGNARFVADCLTHPNRAAERRQETASKQEPFAIILGCSDSRVAPEIIFDQGIGDLFIVRVAGNVVGSIELNSIEFSAVYLHSALIFVLGHESCGVVQAVIEGKTHDIETVAGLLQPSIDEARHLEGDLWKNAVQVNVRRVVAQLKENPVLNELISKEKLLIQGGYYDFHTGQVWLV